MKGEEYETTQPFNIYQMAVLTMLGLAAIIGLVYLGSMVVLHHL